MPEWRAQGGTAHRHPSPRGVPRAGSTPAQLSLASRSSGGLDERRNVPHPALMSFEIRKVTREEVGEFYRQMALGFGGDPAEGQDEGFAAFLEADRTRCAFDAGDLVGTLGTHSLDLAVPGGTLAPGGTPMVTVRSSHRRRGILRGMMRAHLDEVVERGEPLAALWASESLIYERFGYGCASELCRISLERAHSAFARAPQASGRCRLLSLDEARKVLPPLYESLWRDRPGHFARSRLWWEARHFSDLRWKRAGASALRFAVYEEDGEPTGYLQYRQRTRNDDSGLPRGKLHVVELQARNATTRAALWQHALGVDLIDEVQAGNQPVDDPLFWLLADPRRARRSVLDALWVRVLDVPTALSGRRYSAEGRLVLDVRDGFRPENAGTYALDGGPDGAKCARASVQADLQLDVADLGSVLMGGVRLATLARAGRIQGDEAAIRRADQMFAWDPPPWCPEVF